MTKEHNIYEHIINGDGILIDPQKVKVIAR